MSLSRRQLTKMRARIDRRKPQRRTKHRDSVYKALSGRRDIVQAWDLDRGAK